MIKMKIFERAQLDFEICDDRSTHACIIFGEENQILGFSCFTYTESGASLNFTEMKVEDSSLFDGLVRTSINYVALKGMIEMEIYDKETINYFNDLKVELIDNKIQIIEFFSKNNCQHEKE